MISSEMLAELAVDGASSIPIYRQIYGRVVGAVLDGRLAPGARLPSARSLAAQLSIARGTVETAYQLLAGEGYIVSRGAAGTLVDPALDRRLLKSGERRSLQSRRGCAGRRQHVGRPAGAVQVGAPGARCVSP